VNPFVKVPSQGVRTKVIETFNVIEPNPLQVRKETFGHSVQQYIRHAFLVRSIWTNEHSSRIHKRSELYNGFNN